MWVMRQGESLGDVPAVLLSFKRGADPLNRVRRRRCGVEGDHVEADRQAPQVTPHEQEVVGRSHDASLLEEVDTLASTAEPSVAAQSHLDDHQHTALEHDEIELSKAAPVILEQQREAMRDQKIARRGLSSRTRLVAAIHAAIHDQG